MTIMFYHSSQDLELIEATLRFASLKKLRSAEHVEGIFRRFGLPDRRWHSLVGVPNAAEAFNGDQTRLRQWLDSILAADSLSKREMSDLSRTIGRTVVMDAAVEFVARTHQLERRIEVRFDGVEACVSYAVGLLLDDRYRLTHLLRHCSAPGCGKYFLVKPSRGRRGNWCSVNHRQPAERDQHRRRQRRYSRN